MQGIGHLAGAIKNTCAAIDEDQDLDASEYQSLKIILNETERDDDIDPKNEYASLVKPESRIRWVEQKVSIVCPLYSAGMSEVFQNCYQLN